MNMYQSINGLKDHYDQYFLRLESTVAYQAFKKTMPFKIPIVEEKINNNQLLSGTKSLVAWFEPCTKINTSLVYNR